MAAFHLAQVNVARLVAPLDSPQLTGFVSRLDEVNALADRAPGFVWRLTGDGGNNATAVPIYDDDKIIVNMSVWESIEALRAYVYSGAHLEVYKQRRDWFSLHEGGRDRDVVGAGRARSRCRGGPRAPGPPAGARPDPVRVPVRGAVPGAGRCAGGVAVRRVADGPELGRSPARSRELTGRAIAHS